MTDVPPVMHAFRGNFRIYQSLGWSAAFWYTTALPTVDPKLDC
jgi:hypothetical protein